jgi:putative hydrolase of the HAD superfamily
MTDSTAELIRLHTEPLSPIATGVPSRLERLEGVRAVLFDIYGTLLISASGDIDAAGQVDKAAALQAALGSTGLGNHRKPQQGIADLTAQIQQSHERSSQRGIEDPEVEIREIWRSVADQWYSARDLPRPISDGQIEQLALDYELRVNPVWPMPGAVQCMQQLRDGRLALGLVSNAQFFTPILARVLWGHSLADLGLDESLRFYSFAFGQAKPGVFLYEQAVEALGRRGVAAHETLYVGNDMLKDIFPAQQVGFRTALFAGDARSYRPRDGDPRVEKIQPDLVINALIELVHCVLPI